MIGMSQGRPTMLRVSTHLYRPHRMSYKRRHTHPYSAPSTQYTSLYCHSVSLPCDARWAAIARPFVWMFHLPAIVEVLPEQAELVKNPIANRRQVQRAKRVQKTRRQTAKAAIAETHVRLLVQ